MFDRNSDLLLMSVSTVGRYTFVCVAQLAKTTVDTVTISNDVYHSSEYLYCFVGGSESLLVSENLRVPDSVSGWYHFA